MRQNASINSLKPKPPGTPSMVILCKREDTFKEWPVGQSYDNTQGLATAGFFYTGKYIFKKGDLTHVANNGSL